jgi:hypothetical protein
MGRSNRRRWGDVIVAQHYSILSHCNAQSRVRAYANVDSVARIEAMERPVTKRAELHDPLARVATGKAPHADHLRGSGLPRPVHLPLAAEIGE